MYTKIFRNQMFYTLIVTISKLYISQGNINRFLYHYILKYNINNRDEIRKKLTFEQQKEIQKEAIKRIKEIGKESYIILDTHLVIESYEGYIPGMLREYAEILKPDGIAVIISDPDKIFVRRLKDIQIRGRDIENLKRIIEDFIIPINFDINIIEAREGLIVDEEDFQIYGIKTKHSIISYSYYIIEKDYIKLDKDILNKYNIKNKELIKKLKEDNFYLISQHLDMENI